MKNWSGFSIGALGGVVISIGIISSLICFISAWMMALFAIPFLIGLTVLAYFGGLMGSSFIYSKKVLLTLFLLVGLGLPTAIFGPYGIQLARIHLMLSSLTPFPGSSIEESHLNPIAADDSAGAWRIYSTTVPVSFNNLSRFYMDIFRQMECDSFYDKRDDRYPSNNLNFECYKGTSSYTVTANHGIYGIMSESADADQAVDAWKIMLRVRLGGLL